LIGTVSAGSAVVIGVTVVATIVVLGLLLVAVSLLQTARRMRMLADELAEHAAVAFHDVDVVVARARGELDRVDDLIGSAEAITQTVGSASRLAHLAFAGPLIKVMALGAGTARAGRRLRRTS